MTAIARSYTFTDGPISYWSQVESEISNIVTTWNNHDSGVSTWTNVKATTSVITNLDLGSSGVAGSLDIFPSTASKGKVRFTAADSAGDTTTEIVNASQSGARTLTIPDPGASASFVMTGGTQTISGTKTFDGQLIGKGTATNDSASTGYIGERVSSAVTAQAAPTSTNWGDVTSISLTAGDWDVSAFLDQAFSDGTSVTACRIGISTNSGNDATGLTAGDTLGQFTNNSIDIRRVNNGLPIVRMSLTSTTTVYLKHSWVYAGGTNTSAGRITARRVR